MMGKVRVIYVVSTLKRCGPNNQLFNIVSNLDSNVFSAMVVTLSSEDSESFKERFVNANIKVYSLNSHRIFGAATVKSKLQTMVSEFSPDIIHTQGYRADTLIEAISKCNNKHTWKHLCTIRNIPQEDYPMTYGDFLGRSMFKKHILSLNNVNKVIGVSKAVSSNLKGYCNLNNVVCINNGVDVELYCPSNTKEEVEALKCDFGLVKDKVVFISTGHLSSRKDPEFLINGFLKAKIDNSILILVGDGELRNGLFEKYGHESSIIFVGRSDRIADYLKLSDYYISCSISEGLPNSVLEAISTGLPCILSDIEPHMQIFASSESQVGNAYELGTMQKFVDALKQVIKEDLFLLSSNSRELACLKFSAKNMSNKYQDIYLDLNDEK